MQSLYNIIAGLQHFLFRHLCPFTAVIKTCLTMLVLLPHLTPTILPLQDLKKLHHFKDYTHSQCSKKNIRYRRAIKTVYKFFAVRISIRSNSPQLLCFIILELEKITKNNPVTTLPINKKITIQDVSSI